MATVVSLEEAGEELAALSQRALAGEEILIAGENNATVRLVPGLEPRPRIFGFGAATQRPGEDPRSVTPEVGAFASGVEGSPSA